MIFSSVLFLFGFLPCVLTVYMVINSSLRNLWLLLASAAFYFWASGPYSLILLGTILINFLVGLLLDRMQRPGWRSAWLGGAVGLNLGLLAYVKYSAPLALGLSRPDLARSLPQVPVLGVSFFTFHCISYLVDIYRNEVKAEKSLLRMALYISVFPQLLSGPIVLYHQIYDQLRRREIIWDQFEQGIVRFVIGLSKKVLIADVLALTVDQIFACPVWAMSRGMAWLGVPLFGLQVYYDFSGYSDMAIGLGRMFGFRFPENFAYPYTAPSLASFWTRWHMSLSNWFRSYVFFPLSGGKAGRLNELKIVIIFSLIGVWHGASLTYLVYGVWNGLAYVCEARMSRFPAFRRLNRVYLLGTLWVALSLFRSPDLGYALAVLKASLGYTAAGAAQILGPWLYLNPHLLLVVVLGVLGCTPLPWRLVSSRASARFYPLGRVVLVLILLVLSLARVAAVSHRSFIYFQF